MVLSHYNRLRRSPLRFGVIVQGLFSLLLPVVKTITLFPWLRIVADHNRCPKAKNPKSRSKNPQYKVEKEKVATEIFFFFLPSSSLSMLTKIVTIKQALISKMFSSPCFDFI